MKKILVFSLCILLSLTFSSCKKVEKDYNLGNFEAAVTNSNGEIIKEEMGEVPKVPEVIVYDNPWGLDDLNESDNTNKNDSNNSSSTNNQLEISIQEIIEANELKNILKKYNNVQIINGSIIEEIAPFKNSYNYQKVEIIDKENGSIQTFEYNIYNGTEYIRLDNKSYQVVDVYDNNRNELIESNYNNYIKSNKIYYYSEDKNNADNYILYCDSTLQEYDYICYVIDKSNYNLLKSIYYTNKGENKWDTFEIYFNYNVEDFAPWFIENKTEAEKINGVNKITINLPDGSQKTFEILKGFYMLSVLEEGQVLYDSSNYENPIDVETPVEDDMVLWLK